MVVLSNRRLGPGAELLVSTEVASTILREVADAARPIARGRWELELVRWLERRATSVRSPGLDVAEIAWTPDHFDHQRQFLIAAIESAAEHSPHAGALERWRRMIEAHPRESVQFGRRWQWNVTN